MQADYDKKLTEETSKSKDELVEKVDLPCLCSGRVDERKRTCFRKRYQRRNR